MKYSIYLLIAIILTSCNDKMEVDEIEINKAQRMEYSEHDNNVDYRATDLINRKDLDVKSLFLLYQELSDLNDEIVELNSKNLTLIYLDKNGFFDNATVSEIEYLINDQKKLASNIPTVYINYKLFEKAINLNSTLDINRIEKDFFEKNKPIMYSYFDEDDGQLHKFLMASQFFKMKQVVK